MSKQGAEALPAAVPEDLLREVHAFLSLEAPFLIPALPDSGDEDEIDKSLVWARAQGARVDEATLGDVVEGGD